MIHAQTRWVMPTSQEQETSLADELAREFGLPSLVATLLVRRGVQDVEKARIFLYGDEKDLHDPYMLHGMSDAVQIIREAGESGRKLRIYGDYDADGVSSTSLMIHLFSALGFDYDYYIPDRKLEGYGLNREAILRASEAGVQLLVTVDTGISAVTEIEYAKSLGMQVVVTDHHEPPERLPAADAIINPKLPTCSYPFKGLAGVGVAFKLASALLDRPPLEWSELVALGTVADLMPLQGENRILVREGLRRLAEGGSAGFRALAEVSSIDLMHVTSTQIAFGMAPRINASGRLAHADDAVRLLTTTDGSDALAAAYKLDRLNKERQQIVEQMVTEAEAMWLSRCTSCKEAGLPEPSVIVLAAEGWNVGVIGIVASKLLDRHYRPTVILGIDAETGMCKGSARSIAGYDLHAALTACEELLDHYGGHQAAAGMSLHRDRLPDLEQGLCELADRWLSEEDWIRRTLVDGECPLAEANLETIGKLSLLEPYGNGNPAPKLLLTGVEINERRTMGKEGKHLKLGLRSGRAQLEAVCFGKGALADLLTADAKADLIGELAVNEWNGSRRPQLMLSDLRINHVQLLDMRGVRQGREEELRKRFEGHKLATVLGTSGQASWAQSAAASFEPVALGTAEQLLDYGQLPTEVQAQVLVLADSPPSAACLERLLQSCKGLEWVVACYPNGNKSPYGTFPDRQHFADVYKRLRRMNEEELGEDELPRRLSAATGWPPETCRMMLDVFLDLEFLYRQDRRIGVHASPGKRELTSSPVYQAAEQQAKEDAILGAPAVQLADWIKNRYDES
ncbi:single-stranded-DNA-specific exonuclease RecJ [Paenibacillus daejeonensis]|uniref:single-stranded-DNA-specific exonuclease RecJ n=1 Tax=Paenibacillus daejeonensis TaxID=135193 RepID=UPI00037D76EA|nr:single-stranded-DNA-specific exonuclease RecJ [Paenibacillus daejeonensis]